jgi:hypothetical protein
MPGALLFTPLLALAIPYRYVQEEYGLKRTLDGWETPVSSFFASLTPLHAWIFEAIGLSFEEEPSANLFPGFLVIALAAAALVIPRKTGSRMAKICGSIRQVPRFTRQPRLRWLAAGVTLVTCSRPRDRVYVHVEGPMRLRVGGR